MMMMMRTQKQRNNNQLNESDKSQKHDNNPHGVNICKILAILQMQSSIKLLVLVVAPGEMKGGMQFRGSTHDQDMKYSDKQKKLKQVRKRKKSMFEQHRKNLT